MKGSAYTPWFHGDFLRSTAGWTLTERAVYWMLLCAQWESGPLPNDMTRLAAIAGTDVATIKNVWPVVGKKFATNKAGMTNKRMADHHRNYVDFKRRQSEGGKKGMANRYGKSSNVIEFKPSKEHPLG
jgi:uncharacterized protein YdaU (DUF1376 family)